MKRDNKGLFLAALILAAIIFSFLTIYAFGEHKSSGFSVSAKSAVLYQPDLDVFLYSKNADERLPMASTTKIMTALIALENSTMDEKVEIEDAAIGIEGSSAYLKRGDVLTMEELLYALLLQSANDAATAIAYHIGGNVEAFADMMNDRAEKLGLSNTHFENPHGLDGEKHYTTARELALIAAEAMKNEEFKKIVSTYKRTFATEERSRTYVNHNKLLHLYEGCIGVKTGFTKKAGRCLVSSAERNDVSLICVTLGCSDDWNYHRSIYEEYFGKLKAKELSEKVPEVKISVCGGEESEVGAKPVSVNAAFFDGEEERIKTEISVFPFVFAPVEKGEVLGKAIFYLDGEKIAETPLAAEKSVYTPPEKDGFWNRIKEIF